MTRRIIGRDIDLVIADKMAMELEEEIFVQSHMNNISLNKEHVSLFLDAMKYLLQKGYYCDIVFVLLVLCFVL